MTPWLARTNWWQKLKFPKIRKKKEIYIVPTRYGFLFGALILLFMFWAIDVKNPAFLTMISVLITVGVISMYLTHSNLENLEVLDVQLDSGFSGQTSYLRIRAKSKNNTPLVSIAVENTLQDILGNNVSRLSVPIQLQKRGLFQIEEIKFSTVYPFGLFYAWSYWENKTKCFVYPKKMPYRKLEATFRESKSSQFQADDFFGHRMAHPSDPATRIDWKVFSRTETLMAKVFDAHLIDHPVLSLKKAPGANLEEKLSFLASVIDDLNKTRSIYGLSMPDREFPITRGLLHYKQCLQALSEFEGSYEANSEMA